MALTYGDEVLREFRQLIRDEISSVTDIIATGTAIASFEDYKKRTGMIYGLEKSLQLLEEARDIVDKRR